jgi:dipeptidyl aminopeptidase/acylaminoacyl peptidase
MERDLRSTPLYQEIETQFRRALEPALGTISGATEPQVSPDGQMVAFTGTRLEKLEGIANTRVCTVPSEGGEVRTITGGPHNDRAPRWSPDGATLAFLSDRSEPGQSQLYLLEGKALGEARPAPPIEGTVEYIAWSPDGSSILLGVAGRGADLAGGQGSGVHRAADDDLPSWMPHVESGVAEHHWRRLCLYDVAANVARLLTRDGLNVWEAVWAGPHRIAAIVSTRPDEGAWYDASLALIEVPSGQEQVLYRPRWQLGIPATSTDGSQLAVIEALCSDRLLVAGIMTLIDPITGQRTTVDTHGVDVTYLVWRDSRRLVYGGIRGMESVVGEYDGTTGRTRELWTTRDGAGVYYPDPVPTISLLPGDGFVLTVESYTRPPTVIAVRRGEAKTITCMAHQGTEFLQSLSCTAEEVSWTARDGLEIEGLLVRPNGPPPYPLVVHVHGGPVFAYRQSWTYLRLARFLAARGYASLFPNPRGSSGRGQEFVQEVFGDMGGEDTHDILRGVDAMIERGVANPKRVGVTGGSYGGYMSSWIITQTTRFAAAVPVAPVTDWYSEHWLCNIPEFVSIFLQDQPYNPTGRYFERSPVMFAQSVTTPTLTIAGSLDRCTPPTQAAEFHHALHGHGVESELVIYPQEGHGVRRLPAQIDYTTRLVGWFLRHMSPGTELARDREQRKEVPVASR